MDIAELQPRQGNVEITAEVVSVAAPREFNKFGKEGKVANATIKDKTGEMTLTLWNEQVDMVKKGDTVKITNGWVGEWQGEKQLSTGKFGKLEVIQSTGPESQPDEHDHGTNVTTDNEKVEDNSEPSEEKVE